MVVSATRAKHLAVGEELGMYLQTYYSLVVRNFGHSNRVYDQFDCNLSMSIERDIVGDN